MQSLTEFRSEYLDLMLRFLWRQWSALGVAGHTDTSNRWPVDPEALLAFTCTVGRYDSRLFDEVLDWLLANERFINVQRLKTLVKEEGFKGGMVLSAIAGFLAENGKKRKWQRLAEDGESIQEERHLFRRPDNGVLPVVGTPDPLFLRHGWLRNCVNLRGLSTEFPCHSKTALWMRLRALFGVSARCEILLYLLTAGRTGSSTLARQVYFFHRTIQDALGEMAKSGLVQSRRLGRERVYSLPDAERWQQLLGVEAADMEWVCWPPLLSALEAVWLCIQPDVFAELSPMLQMSQLREVMHQGGAAKLTRSGVGVRIPDEEALAGMQYLEELFDALRELLQ